VTDLAGSTESLPSGLTPPGVLVLAGPFGSGKTEISINLALRWARHGPVYLADLDVVTPYFRPRDIAAELTAQGVRVLAPGGGPGAFDGPVLPHEMPAAIAGAGSSLLIDVGGQPHGAGVLAHWREALLARNANVALVVNPRRPDGDSVEGLAGLAEAIVARAGLPLGGVVANGNLGPQTTVADGLDGLRVGEALARRLGVSVLAACCPKELVAEFAGLAGSTPVLGLRFYLRPAWEV